MKIRILTLAFCVAAIGAVGCNKTNDSWGSTGAGTSRPATRPIATQPDNGTPADRSPEGATGSSASSSSNPQAIPSESHQVKEDTQNLAKDTATTKRDEIYTRLYKQFLQETPGKHVDTADKGATIDVPAGFKSNCKDVGKDGKLTTVSNDYKAFFTKADVKQDCAQAYSLDQQADKAK